MMSTGYSRELSHKFKQTAVKDFSVVFHQNCYFKTALGKARNFQHSNYFNSKVSLYKSV
jgi:hypothetical protein